MSVSVLTDKICSLSNVVKTEQEVSAGGEEFLMFNSGGVEVEVAELLYGLIRVWKPESVLETGTHKGISSAYMAEALKDNNKGHLVTYEVIKQHKDSAEKLWQDLGLSEQVECRLESSLNAQFDGTIDFLFLDSEPQFRFDEFVKFWPQVKEGGLIGVHDLHPNLGHHGQTYHNTYDWPYGFWEPKLGEYVKNFQVQTLHFPNPRGMTFFQKTRAADENIRLLRAK